MKRYIIILFALLTIACDEEDAILHNSYFHSELEFLFQDPEGNNLLDPEVNERFLHQEIEIHYIDEEGKKQTASHTISYARGYYTLQCEVNADVCYLKLSESIVDAIATAWLGGSDSNYMVKMWYNGELAWDREQEFPIVITK